MLAFSTDYIFMRLAGKWPGCGATLFSSIGVTRTSKVQLHRRTPRIYPQLISSFMASVHRAPMQQLTADTKTVINSDTSL